MNREKARRLYTLSHRGGAFICLMTRRMAVCAAVDTRYAEKSGKLSEQRLGEHTHTHTRTH